MQEITIIFISIGLAMDCFAVSLSAGAGGRKTGILDTFRIAAVFGGFQSGMALIGWLAGSGFVRYIEKIDHWVAFGLLFIIGGKMILESFEKESEKRPDYRGIKTLFLLGVATSIDSLAIGVSLPILNYPLVFSFVSIGAASFLFSIAGVYLGKKTGEILGSKAETAGGVILILIGVKILLEHTVL